MAMTATISLNPSTMNIGQQTAATLTISNSGGADVIMTSIEPTCIFTGALPQQTAACALGRCETGPGLNQTVPAGGTLIYTFTVNFFFPSTGIYGTGSGTYSVGANCQSNDGSRFIPTAATITVNPIPLPTSETL